MSDNLPEIPRHTTPSLVGQNIFANEESFKFAQRVATLLAQSKLVPPHYQNNVPDCLLAFQRSLAIDTDPFVFMQHTSVIKGRICVEGKFIAALINARGHYVRPIGYDYKGQGEDRECICYGETTAGEIQSAKCTVKMAKEAGWWAQNPHWRNLTDLMLGYRAAKFLGNQYLPHLVLGLLTKEEVLDIDGVQVISPAKRLSKLNKPIESKGE